MSAARLPIPSLRHGVRVYGRRMVSATLATLEHNLKRIHRKLFRLNGQIGRLESQRRQVSAELDYHRSINDDAQMDASIGNYIDREEAGLTAADVRRFERAIADIDSKSDKLTAKRDQLLSRLPD